MAGDPTNRLDLSADGLAARLGGRLREQRRGHGLTLKQVAEQAEVSVSYVSAIEKGVHVPSIPVLTRLAGALRVTVHDILADEQQTSLRTGSVAREPGAFELSNPDLRLRIAALVASSGDTGSPPLPVDTGELFVFLDRGALLLEIDGTTYPLGQGDALDALDVTHVSWSVIGEADAVSIWVTAPKRGNRPAPGPQR